jgi:hypothetical protein
MMLDFHSGFPQFVRSLRFQVSGINKFRIMAGEGESVCVHWNPRCLPRASGEDLEDSLLMFVFVQLNDQIQFLKRAIRALSMSLDNS